MEEPISFSRLQDQLEEKNQHLLKLQDKIAEERLGKALAGAEGAMLDALFNWIKNNFRPVVIVIFTGFGLFFLFKGISELIA